MTDEAHHPLKGDSAPKLDAEALMLCRARASVACESLDEATELLTVLAGSRRPQIAVRAGLQLAMVAHRRGDEAEAVERLTKVASLVEQQREGSQERRGLDECMKGARNADTQALQEFQMELARAWARVGSTGEAQSLYRKVLREVSVAEAGTSEERHLAALAEYRLAELLIGSEPSEAWPHWKRALDSGDEHVSPYAALRLATEGSEELVQGRIEQLFRYAMGSSDPKLHFDAALGLARHLRTQRQFVAARTQLDHVIENASCDEEVAKARRELDSLDAAERMAPERRRLTRSKQLRAQVLARIGSARAKGEQVIVVGAGGGAIHLLESLDNDKYTICGFVDDYAKAVPGYPEHRILGTIDQLPNVIQKHKPRQVLLAVPTLPGARRRAVVEACRRTNTPLLNLPRLHELGIGWRLNDSRRRMMTQLRPVEVEEILGEESVEIDSLATGWLQHQTALVIGAGALGAELCRRLADGLVGKLVVIDRRPSALKKIEDDLSDTRGFWEVEALTGDATDRDYLTGVFESWAPTIVLCTTGCSSARALAPANLARDFSNWREIFANEIMAAAAVAQASAAAKVPTTVYVSSRRAAHPVDPFGAMKALSEEIVLFDGTSRPGAIQTVVRVGTLLDSRNGRLARLKQQIRSGAPVRIPKSDDSVLYLSTARWAELVLHAARIAADGDLLEPVRGEEIKIRAIAEEAIRLRGLYPDEHVIIQEVESERWDDPPSDGPRTLKDRELGIYALERQVSTEQTVAAALARWATHIGEHGGSSESEFWAGALRDLLQEDAVGERSHDV